MRKRVVAGAVVTAFAVVVATVAILAGNGGHKTLQKLPLAATGGSGAAGRDSAASAMLAPIRAVEYRVSGPLPALDGPATAYRLSSAIASDRIAKLAKAFGLTGAVKEDPDGFTVQDSVNQLRVTKDASLPWSYGPYYTCPETVSSSDGSVAPDGAVSSSGCAVSGGGVVSSGGAASTPGSSGSGGSGGSGTVEPAQPTEPNRTSTKPAPPPGSPVPMPPETTVPQRPADLPTKEHAQTIATDLLRAGGIDLTDATIRVEDGFTQWQVTVDPSIDGRPVTGMSTGVSVGSKDKIAYANGFLGDPKAIGDYPLVGTAKGVERLKSGFSIGPQPMMGGAEKAPAIAVDGGPTAGAPGVGAPTGGTDDTAPVTTLPPQVLTITGARLGLSYVADYRSAGRGTGYLVPAYIFTLDDGTTTSVVAVTDDLLASTTGTGTGPGVDVVPNGKR
ncbi:MAG: hypothetical protein QOG03_367 [Actinomycetota bacterium]|jgi:hypothetical protein|nr:hypothetical protein [Actinomycetota bacterium]